MSLIKCPECSNMISDKAVQCPKCGIKPVSSASASCSTCHNNYPSSLSACPVCDAMVIDKETEWHYSIDSERKGPVLLEELSNLVDSGKLDLDTLVWKAGMREWQSITSLKELSFLSNKQAPPPLSVKAMANGYIWAVALAPIWGSFVQIMATEMRVAISKEVYVLYSSMWPVMLLCNILTIMLDCHKLKQAGYNVDKLKSWMYLVVPVYIYQRDKLVKDNMTRFWVWVAAFLLSLVMFKF